ncbi:MAG: DUF1573 domain-containing protein [Pirellulales bacterium]|nr:DUF1573 domain-containing protein [Pirellulales bacterium]
MWKINPFWCVVALVFWVATGSPAMAQPWAKEMFKETSHDFGTVARGAKAEFAFRFENLYLEDVHIKNVRTSCGCANLKYPTEVIKTYEQKSIVVTVDTRSFLGRKDATVTVEFDKPFRADVPLQIHCYIRRDVVFQPGVVQFGTIKQGQAARRKVIVTYAGRPDWKIVSVRSPHPFIETKLTETVREGNPAYDRTTRVTYDLEVELKPDAPPGYLSGHLVLKTNDADPQKSEVPLAIDGVIEAALTVRPASFTFLAVSGGEARRLNAVVQAAKPFRVTQITCTDARFQWTLPTVEATHHILPIRFTPGTETGKVNARLRIKTSLPGAPELMIDLNGEVAAAPEE